MRMSFSCCLEEAKEWPDFIVKAVECCGRSWKVFYKREITMPDVRVARWKVEERCGMSWNEDDSRVSACCLEEEGEERTGVSRA
ncbi:BZ3500_MvSof-1268-A1-R1_Chr4-2g07039 [Microbotryum saponariae]|uniref:BZ3500_MvSof-1268-A1-R1_Chr4-2g07039 protein n=1 Tax=Microbotryum saponariae TaxID=289078 RepID=A0A2X0LI06_9BASI|nr:BZ3500_MvSof-1268-A1-R1_Chr4-2g07039 [Microbotryum saponariae]SDA06704.1 BZ3501_MvSof-1269-A2-R1_Chr4-2g06750 [Microbotryum saponariae]